MAGGVEAVGEPIDNGRAKEKRGAGCGKRYEGREREASI